MSALFNQISGRYLGRKCLFLSWMNPPEHWSDSQAELRVAPHPQALELRYDWSYEGQARHGLLLLVLDPGSDQATGAWTDSWHQSSAVMCMSGTYGEDFVDVRGTYAVAGHPPWGWRIRLAAVAAELQLDMYNRPPDGADEMAVQIRWLREPD